MSTDTVLDGVMDGTVDGAAPAVEPEPSSAAKPKKSRPKPRAAKAPEAPPAPATAVSKPKARKAPSSGLPTDATIYAASVMIKQASDPTRIKIMLLLVRGEKNVGDLCVLIRQSQPATSHHLALLRHGGVIQPRRDGKNNFYSLTPKGEALAGVVREMFN